MQRVTVPAEVETPARRASSHPAALRQWMTDNQYVAVLALLVVMFIVFSITQPRFFTAANIRVLLTNVSILWMVSLGLTVVMLTGGYDLSLAAMVGLSGFFFVGFFSTFGVPAIPAIVLTVLAGALIGGAINGVLVGRLGVPFLVVTIGSLSIFEGTTYLVSGTQTISVTSGVLNAIGFDSAGGVPITVWIMAGTLVVAYFVLHWTYFGRDVYAVGGNAAAARLSGVHVTRTLVLAYAISGGMAALGGVLEVSRISAASPTIGTTIIFSATAAVLIGGTVLGGGIGGVVGTVVGVLFLGVLQNGLALSGLASSWQEVVSGAIVVLAVLFHQLQHKGKPLVHRRRPGTLDTMFPVQAVRGSTENEAAERVDARSSNA
ncbi:MAG: ABC transporter permease [Actinomycetota bacterium]|nr:ABC transporter permease [Actinomycetota bacterium]